MELEATKIADLTCRLDNNGISGIAAGACGMQQRCLSPHGMLGCGGAAGWWCIPGQQSCISAMPA
jgi:hypothetical protein